MTMRSVNGRFQGGVTLIELVVTISILAVLVSLAIPSFIEFLKNNRVNSQTNELVALINLAKNEAIRRHLSIGEGLEVALQIRSTLDGWEAEVITSDPIDPTPGCEAGVIRCVENQRVEFSTGEDEDDISISFDSRGYLRGTTWEPIGICLRHTACNGANQHRRLEILPSGRIEIERLGCEATCG